VARSVRPNSTNELTLGEALGGGAVVGSITSIVAARNVRNTELYAYMDQLNEFMLQHALPRKLQKRLREFFRNRIAGPQSMQDYGSLWSKMTPSLRTEVVMLTSANLLLQHRVFCMCPPDFTAAVAMAMQSEFFAGRELIVTRKDYPTKMHVVTRGLATSEGRMYASGMLLGVDMLFAMFLARHEVREPPAPFPLRHGHNPRRRQS
jgi:hypothetical protein